MRQVAALHETIDLSDYKSGHRSAAVACSASGATYYGAAIRSETNVQDVSAEQVALLIAVQHGDYQIEQVLALQEGEAGVSPLTLKIIADFSARVGSGIGYRLLNSHEEEIFAVEDTREV